MDEEIRLLTGDLLPGLGLAVLLLLACIGAGEVLLRLLFPSLKRRILLSLTFGADAFALCTLIAGTCGVNRWTTPVFFLFAVPGLRKVWKFPFRKGDWFLLIPGTVLLFYGGFALVPPFAWDDAVYQMTVPLRWARDGGFRFYPDLVYSAFPLLPQFLYTELIRLSGLHAARFFAFFMFGGTAFCFRSFLPGRKAWFPALLLLASPIILHGATASYAEPFIALNFMASLLCFREPLAAGIFSGFAFAVKLNGIFASAVSWVFLIFRKKDSFLKTTLLFAAGAAAASFLFYLRPLILTGDPFYPYLVRWFPDAALSVREMSLFHHTAGSGVFGVRSAAEILTAPLFLTLPGYSSLYDGSWGIGLLGMFLLSLLTLKKNRFPRGLIPLLLFYLFWLFLTPQTRFLLPAVLPVLLFGTIGLERVPKKVRLVSVLLLVCIASGTVLSTNSVRNLLLCWRKFREKSNILYTLTGADMVPEAHTLRGLPGKTLLAEEERTLYFPADCIVATPFFQAEYWTPPDKADPEDVKRVLIRSGARRILLRVPADNPDLSKEHLRRSEPFFQSVLTLEKEGFLIRRPVPSAGNSFLFERKD